jgi:chromosome segregation ATPase
MGYISYLEDIEELTGTYLDAVESAAENPTASPRDLREAVAERIAQCREVMAELTTLTSDPAFRAQIKEIDRLDSFRAAQKKVLQLKRQNAALGRLTNEGWAAVRKRDGIITDVSKDKNVLRDQLDKCKSEIRTVRHDLDETKRKLTKARADAELHRKEASRLQKQIDDREWRAYTGGKKR